MTALDTAGSLTDRISAKPNGNPDDVMLWAWIILDKWLAKKEVKDSYDSMDEHSRSLIIGLVHAWEQSTPVQFRELSGALCLWAINKIALNKEMYLNNGLIQHPYKSNYMGALQSIQRVAQCLSAQYPNVGDRKDWGKVPPYKAWSPHASKKEGIIWPQTSTLGTLNRATKNELNLLNGEAQKLRKLAPTKKIKAIAREIDRIAKSHGINVSEKSSTARVGRLLKKKPNTDTEDS